MPGVTLMLGVALQSAVEVDSGEGDDSGSTTPVSAITLFQTKRSVIALDTLGMPGLKRRGLQVCPVGRSLTPGIRRAAVCLVSQVRRSGTPRREREGKHGDSLRDGSSKRK